MRTIKFRGRNGNMWVYGNLHVQKHEELGDSAYVVASCEKPATVQVDVRTVGQFTGLHDKNGKEIYEGDIVLTKYGRICEIGWFGSECHNGWDLNPIEWKNKAPDQFDLYLSENLEVIGNIHDNPELLKGGE